MSLRKGLGSSDGKPRRSSARRGGLKLVLGWVLPQYNSTFVNLVLVVQQNCYRISYGEGDLDGVEFTGPACSGYSNFVAALKKEFTGEQYHLSFFSERAVFLGDEESGGGVKNILRLISFSGSVMLTKWQTAKRLHHRSTARAAFFALPFVVAVGAIVYSEFGDAIWQRVTAVSNRSVKAPSQDAVPPARQSRANETATAVHAEPATSPPAAVRTLPIPAQKLTRPLQALPQWHRFPTLPNGIKAKGRVGAELVLMVGEDGSIVDASVEVSTGANWLDQQAIDWVKSNWRYRPALVGTKPVIASTRALVFFTPRGLRAG